MSRASAPAGAGSNMPPALDAPRVDWALFAVRRFKGARVFPVSAGARTPPLTKHGHNDASADEEQVRKWWTRNPDANIGLTGVIAIDVDVKDGKPGAQSFRDLGFSPSDVASAFVTRTPSGGFHFIFEMPDDLAPRFRNAWRPGLDLRAGNGYVIAPGSVLTDGEEERRYVVERDPGNACKCPEAVRRLIEAEPISAERAPRNEVAAGAVIDDPCVIERAAKWLAEEAPAAIKGQSGDHTTFKAACELRDLGLSQATAFDLMAEHYNPRCCPEWDLEGPDNLLDKVANAYAYAAGVAGSKHPEAAARSAARDFDGVNVQPPKRPSRWRWRHGDPVDFNMAWLFFEKLPRVGTALMVGPSGAGKSFLAAHTAGCLSQGNELFGTEPDERCGVAIFAAEGVAATPNRLSALGKPGAELPIWCAPVSNLHSAAEKARMRELVKEAQDDCAERFGIRLGVIIVDTLAASGLLEDENNNSQCAAAVKFAEELAADFGCLALFTHHPPKNGSGARGGSALHAGFDTVLEVRHDGGPVRVVECTKSRDAPTRRWGAFTLIPQTLGLDSKGREVTTCTVSTSTGGVASNYVASPELAEAIRREVGTDMWRRSHQAAKCIHEPIGRAAGLDPENRAERRQIELLLRAGLSAGWLHEVVAKDDQRKERAFITAGEPTPIAPPAQG